MEKLSKCEANYVPLTPLTFLKRAASVYANRISIIYEGTRFTWHQTYERCCRLASSLRSLEIPRHSVVSVLAPNIPATYEMHFAVPMAEAVLNTINIRLDAKNIASILRHSEAKVFFVDCQFLPLAREALRLLMEDEAAAAPLVIVIDDIDSPTGIRIGELEYEEFVNMGDPRFLPEQIQDEWDPITLNYTSGTTSAPKGVVYSHRGAYLSTLSLILGWEMGTEPVYLWTLPMFHCNGWSFTWGVAARGGTNVCLRNPTAYDIYRNISEHKVTHMCCAPVIFNTLIGAAKPNEERHQEVQILTGGSPPPAALLEQMEQIGFHVTHAYGLTEATGPALVCEWQSKWNQLPRHEQSKLKARQGISILTLDDVDVKNKDTMSSVPRDGKSMGEIFLRGSSIMKGYLKNERETSESFRDGWFHTGDVGVIHPDGYLEIKDRSKDVIISGGENISSVELEAVLYRHPRVLAAAVVSMPHPRWGESPCAFISVKENNNNSAGITNDDDDDDDVKEADIISYCRKNLSHFMVPKKVVILPNLPIANGKVQKFKLRALAKSFVVSSEEETVEENVQKRDLIDQSPTTAPILAMSRL